MNSLRRRLILTGLAGVCAGGAHAQSFPARPIKLIVPLAPGGATDLVARVMAERLGARLGQPVIVDNRGGAGGTVGSHAAALSAPDGYTLLMGTIGTLAVSPSMYRKLPYDSDRDLVPVARVATGNFALVVHSTTPVQSMTEFIRLAKARPREFNYGSAGSGSMPHLGMELISRAASIELTHVPYKSSGQLVTALIGKEVQAGLPDMPSVLQHVRAGKLRALAVAGPTRDPQLPDVPTLAEAGVAQAEVTSWLGVMAPARLPLALIEQLNEAIVKTMSEPAVANRLAELGVRAVTSTSGEFREFLARERAQWDTVVKASGVIVE